MKVINFTTNPVENEKACPVISQGDRLFNLSYYTLCKISDAIGYTYPTPKSVALYCVENGCQTLTLDDLGNFISLKPTY